METNSVEQTQATPVVAPERTRVAKAAVEITGNVLTFKFAHGDTLIVDYDKLTPAMKLRAGLHGLEQKFRDTYAGAKTSQEAQGLAEKAYDHVYDPDDPKWNAGRESGEPKADSSDLLARAIVRASAGLVPPQILDLAETKSMVEGLSKGDRAKFRAKPKVALAIAQIRAEEDSDESSL